MILSVKDAINVMRFLKGGPDCPRHLAVRRRTDGNGAEVVVGRVGHGLSAHIDVVATRGIYNEVYTESSADTSSVRASIYHPFWDVWNAAIGLCKRGVECRYDYSYFHRSNIL